MTSLLIKEKFKTQKEATIFQRRIAAFFT